MRYVTIPKPQTSNARQALLALRARQHRSALNFPEQLLWRALSAGKLGVYFRRQVPLAGRYIVDFLAPSIGLVVEVDGSAHEHRHGADGRRDEKLRRLGYRVLRVEAGEVMQQRSAVVRLIRDAIAQALGA